MLKSKMHTSETAVEDIIRQANADSDGAGYQLFAQWPDGSRINGSVSRCGPDWAVFRDLPGLGEIYVNVAGATLWIGIPEPGKAKGPRFP